MTLSDYLTAFKQGWWIVLGTLLVGLTIAAAVVVRQPTVYSASAQLFVSASVQVSRDGSNEWYDVAGARVISYATVAGGDKVGDEVAQLLGGEPDASVSISAVPDTVIIAVRAQGSDPQTVADVVDAYTEVLPAVIDDVEESDRGTEVDLTPIASAEVPESADPRPILATMASAGILAFGLGAVLVIVREVLRRERRGADVSTSGAGR